MFPFGFVLGAVTGVAAVLVLGTELTQRARPVAKAALKAALMAIHEAQVHGAEVAEAAEDIFAEAKSEVAAEVFGAAMAAAQAKAATQAAQAQAKEPAGPRPAAAKAARKRSAVKRSRAIASRNG